MVMGVSGAGKTTVGRALARRLQWPFHEGDDFHPQENVRKMAKDEPLTDADRRPWLERIRDLVAREAARGGDAVVTCSCLKRAYRDLVRAGGDAAEDAHDGDVRFVHLELDPEAAAVRVGGRLGHFFDASLVGSQFRDLEPPRRALTLDATRPVQELVAAVIEAFCLRIPPS
jgi:gluconokinase